MLSVKQFGVRLWKIEFFTKGRQNYGERANIQYRLNSGRAQYIANGGKLGRKEGYRKPDDQLREEYKNAIALLRKGYSIRAVAKLEGVSPTTIQKIKAKFVWKTLSLWLLLPRGQKKGGHQ